MTLSIVIPVYNGETTIKELNIALKKELDGSYPYKIIMVCDPGGDNTFEIVRNLVNEDTGHSEAWYPDKRLGQHKAILYGIGKSSGDFIVTIDDDLQHDPVYIKDMIRKQQDGNYDVVYAVFGKLSHNTVRKYASDLFRKLLSVSVPGICPWYSPYRLIRRETAMKMLAFSTPYVFIDGLLGRVTRSFGSIEAEHRERGGGRTAYGLYRLVRHAFLILLNYSKASGRDVRGET